MSPINTARNLVTFSFRPARKGETIMVQRRFAESNDQYNAGEPIPGVFDRLELTGSILVIHRNDPSRVKPVVPYDPLKGIPGKHVRRFFKAEKHSLVWKHFTPVFVNNREAQIYNREKRDRNAADERWLLKDQMMQKRISESDRVVMDAKVSLNQIKAGNHRRRK